MDHGEQESGTSMAEEDGAEVTDATVWPPPIRHAIPERRQPATKWWNRNVELPAPIGTGVNTLFYSSLLYLAVRNYRHDTVWAMLFGVMAITKLGICVHDWRAWLLACRRKVKDEPSAELAPPAAS